LLANAPIERIQTHYVTQAFLVLEDADAQAVLAAAGDQTPSESLDEHASKLEKLHAALLRSFLPNSVSGCSGRRA